MSIKIKELSSFLFDYNLKGNSLFSFFISISIHCTYTISQIILEVEKNRGIL